MRASTRTTWTTRLKQSSDASKSGTDATFTKVQRGGVAKPTSPQDRPHPLMVPQVMAFRGVFLLQLNCVTDVSRRARLMPMPT